MHSQPTHSSTSPAAPQLLCLPAPGANSSCASAPQHRALFSKCPFLSSQPDLFCNVPHKYKISTRHLQLLVMVQKLPKSSANSLKSGGSLEGVLADSRELNSL